MSEFAQTHLVWYGLISVFARVIQQTAAVAAWGDLYGDAVPTTDEEQFVLFLIDAVSDRLILELTRIFDTDKYKAEENCCLKMLKMCCLSDTRHFPKGENDRDIVEIDRLCDSFNSIIPKEVRNKQIAHLDLPTLFSLKPAPYVFSDILNLVVDTRLLLSGISERFVGITTEMRSIEAEKDKYYQLLRRLLGKTMPT